MGKSRNRKLQQENLKLKARIKELESQEIYNDTTSDYDYEKLAQAYAENTYI